MRIKKLKLHGFKSFPDQTELELDAPITALVGPNGCGKSNIVDAIKWVLGSQSPTSLRGDEMADVIFKGSANRQPLGFAKAEFVIDNEDGEIPVDYTEVAIGRKLYRSGESVYMINGEEVRLKDIKELLYDTGIGVENYSLIEQGRIDRVLSSSAKERRELLEEAAGISTFQARKQEAQRKLGRVEDDLERVRDLLGELRREIHSLKTQAGKAKKYRSHKEELEEKKLLLHIDRYEELVEKEERLYGEWQDAKEKRSRVQEKMKSARKDEQSLTKDLQDLEQSLDALRSRRNDREKEVLEVENAIEQIQTRLENINKEHQRLSEQDLDEIAERIESLEEKIEETERRRSRQQEEKEEVEHELTELDAKIEEFERGLDRLDEDQQELQEQKEDLQKDRSKKQRERERVENRLQRIEEDVVADRREMEEMKEEIEEEEAKLSSVRRSMEEKKETIKRHRGDLALLRSTLVKKEEEKETVQSKLERSRETLEDIESRIQYLESLEEQKAGLSEGAKAILDQYDRDAENGVHGLLGEHVEFTDLGHRTIQGVLEPFLKYVVVSNWSTAREVVEKAREEEGSVGVFVLSAVQAPSRQTTRSDRPRSLYPSGGRVRVSDGENGRGNGSRERKKERRQPLLQSYPYEQHTVSFPSGNGNEECTMDDLIEGGDRFQRIVRDVLQAHGFEVPFSSSSDNGTLFPPDGTSADRKGILSTASGTVYVRGETRVEESVVDRRRELEELCEKRESIRETIRKRAAEKKKLEVGLDSIQQSMKKARTAVYEAEVDLDRLEERSDWLKEQLEVKRQELELLESNLEEYAEEKERLKEKREELEGLLERLSEHETSIDEKIEELNEEKRKARSRLRDMQDQKQELNIRSAQLEEQVENSTDLIRRHREDLQQAEERIETIQRRMEELEQQREEQIERLESKRAEKVRGKQDVKEIEQEMEDVRERKEKIERRQQEIEEKRKEIVETYNEIQQRSQELKLHLKEAESNRENLEERAEEQLQTDLEEAMEEVDPGEEFDRERIEEEVEELETTLNRMGNVNLAALDQLEQKQERVEEIEEQEEDLKTSKQRLQRIIRKMKNESHKRFKNTLEQGKENFNKLFRKLFGGGKATLKAVYDEEESADDDEEREDEDAAEVDDEDQTGGGSKNGDLLECGIEIYAQPPGKEMSKLSLLSGGERAMTSIALMMALFMLNPSAICILDEADAPLDESNLDLFIGLLNEFTDITQFLVITHKKKTIAAADRVYGLTMQEDGVSQMVSMDLEKRIPEEYLEEDPEEQPSSVAGDPA